MKKKSRKYFQNIEHRGGENKITENYNLELELIHNANKDKPVYSFKAKSLVKIN